MKNRILIMMLLIFLCLFCGCGNKVEEKVTIVVPQGNPYIAIGNLIGEENIVIESVNGAAGVKNALVSNQYDMVIAPLNLGVQLYNNGNSKYKLDSVIAFGNTYIVSNKNVLLNDIKDLDGKTILAYSRGGTPDIILQYVFEKNNVNANVEYMNSLSEVVPMFVQGKYDYILAAEPVITNMQIKLKKEINIMNLQEYTNNTIMQAAIFINADAKNIESIKKVISKIEKNIKNMNANPKKYSEVLVNKDIYFEELGVEILTNSIPRSNLSFMKANENIDEIKQYLEMIKYNIPNEEFYY